MKKLLLTFLSILLPSVAIAEFIIPEADPTPSNYKMPIYLVDATDDETPEPGLSITTTECQVAVPDDMGDFDNCTGTITEVANGVYTYTPAAADIDVPGTLVLKINDTAANVFITTAQIIPTADGTLQGTPTTTSLQLASAETYGDDELIGAEIEIVSATAGAGQMACVTDYVSSTDTATVQTLATAPTGTVRYRVHPGTNCQITAAGIADDAITAAKIATDAITSSELASTAITEIQSGLATSSALATVDSNVDAILVDTGTTLDGKIDSILDDTGTSGVAIADNSITAAKIATDAIGSDELAASALAEINTEADAALSDIGLDHLMSTSVIGTDVTDNSVVALLVSASGTADFDSYDNTTDSLEALSSSAGPTAAQIADAVWTETIADHSGTVGSTAEAVSFILTDTGTTLDGKIDVIDDYIDTEVAAILADTDSLDSTKIPDTISLAAINGEVDTALTDIGLDHLLSTTIAGTDVTDNSLFALLVSSSATADFDNFDNTTDSLEAIAASGGGGPTASEIADAVWDEAQGDHTTAGTFGETATEIASILTDTNSLDGTKIPDTISLANINSEVDTALTDIGLDHLLSASVAGTDVTDNSIIAFLVSSSATADYDTFDNTTDSLQAAADSGGGGPTASQIADAVWTEAIGDHSGTVGSTAEAVSFILTDTGTTLDGKIDVIDDYIDTEVAAILADTSSLDGTKIPDTLSLANINAEADTAIADASLATAAALTTVDTVVDAIKAKTDNLTFTTANKIDARIDYVGTNAVTTPNDFKADVSALATAAALTTVDGVVDAILADTGTDGVVLATNAVDADAIADDAIDAGAIAADAIGASEFAQAAADEVWTSATRTLSSGTNLNIPTVAGIADGVWEELIADHSGTSGSVAETLDTAGSGADASAIADAVWDELLAGHTTENSASDIVQDALTKTLSCEVVRQ